jgi:hypothetical protein
MQSFLQAHMRLQGAPEKLYKSHSLRKGGATALLAAGVPLPQIQLMARWASPNMTQLYASLTKQRLVSAFTQLGGMLSLDVVSEVKRFFWKACTTRPGWGSSGGGSSARFSYPRHTPNEYLGRELFASRYFVLVVV